MPDVTLNWWAVIVAALINMAIGAAWYSPGVFGKQWAKLLGKPAGDGDTNQNYAIMALGAIIQAWILAHFVRYAADTTFWRGAVTGFWLWLAFIAVVLASATAFEGRRWKLWEINTGYYLVVLVITGGLLAAWR